MSNEIQIFNNEQFGEIRTIEMDGKALFCATDVARALGYSDTSKAIKAHCKEDGWAIYPVIDSLGREQQAKFINEGNVYRLIAHSKLPAAEKFERWVFDEVLPSIRKTGGYSVQRKPDSYMIDDPIERAKRWIEEKEDYLKLESKIKEDEPKVAFADKVADASNLIDIGQMAKLLNDQNIPIGRNRLFQWLRKEKYLRGNNEPYQKYIDNGIFAVKELTYTTPYGQQIAAKTYVTGKGQIFIAEILRKQFAKETA